MNTTPSGYRYATPDEVEECLSGQRDDYILDAKGDVMIDSEPTPAEEAYMASEPMYVEQGIAACIVEGNGMIWEEPIWLPDLVAADLIECGVIEMREELVDWPDGTRVNEFRLAR